MINLPKQDTGHWLWFLQRLTGILLVITLIIHFVVMHFTGYDSGDAYTYARVVSRLQNPWYKLLDISFLTFAVFHGFHGLWMVGRDYLHSNALRLALAGTVVALAVVIWLWGAITVIPFVPSLTVGVNGL